MTRPLVIIEQYWRRAAAGMHNVFGQPHPPQPRIEELERDILALTTEKQTLTGSLERLRTDYERHRSEITSKIKALEHTYTQAETTRTADARQLNELKQRLGEVEADRERLTAIEDSLAESTNRLETRHNQLKFLQGSAREQLEAFKTALAEATSRLETRDNELDLLQDSANKRLEAFEASLADTSNRFESTAGEIRELREGIAGEARQFETSISAATARLESTNNRVEALEKQFETDHRLLQNVIQDLQARLHSQDKRIFRTMLIAILVLALLTVAGAILL